MIPAIGQIEKKKMVQRNAQLRILGFATSALLPGEIGVDLFAGGGGWAEGFFRATGVPPAIAVNHDAAAIAMHIANHPETEHYHEDIYAVDPVSATRGRPVGWLHLSPDCTHFSRAKGGKPRSQKIRALASIAIPWAKATRPRIISLENVAEFVTWGPLDDEGNPIKARAGETFRAWVAELESLAYVVEWRVLNAADYGAPTSRKRLFLIARRDGRPIVWPEKTHGPGREHAYRTAAECIDWSITIPSIFDRKKPLAEATQRRIAEGIRRYVLNNPRPFLVRTDMQSDGHLRGIATADEPLRTITTRSGHAVVVPSLLCLTHGGRNEAADEPLRTTTTAHRGERALIAPTLIQTSYGEREGQKPRVLDLHQPLGTVVAGGQKHALVAAFLAKHFGGVVGQDLRKTIGTITAKDHHSLVSAHLTKFHTGSVGSPLDAPVPTVTANSHGKRPGGSAPLGVVAVHMESMYSNSKGSAADQPMPTVTAQGGHVGVVAAFMAKYYGNDQHGAALDEPMHTVTTKDRLGLVTVTIDGEEFVIADIGMRMLQPRELARAQGFPDSYILTGTKTQQVARIGNSVPPDVAEAIVRANTIDEAEEVAA